MRTPRRTWRWPCLAATSRPPRRRRSCWARASERSKPRRPTTRSGDRSGSSRAISTKTAGRTSWWRTSGRTRFRCCSATGTGRSSPSSPCPGGRARRRPAGRPPRSRGTSTAIRCRTWSSSTTAPSKWQCSGAMGTALSGHRWPTRWVRVPPPSWWRTSVAMDGRTWRCRTGTSTRAPRYRCWSATRMGPSSRPRPSTSRAALASSAWSRRTSMAMGSRIWPCPTMRAIASRC